MHTTKRTKPIRRVKLFQVQNGPCGEAGEFLIKPEVIISGPELRNPSMTRVSLYYLD